MLSDISTSCGGYPQWTSSSLVRTSSTIAINLPLKRRGAPASVAPLARRRRGQIGCAGENPAEKKTQFLVGVLPFSPVCRPKAEQLSLSSDLIQPPRIRRHG